MVGGPFCSTFPILNRIANETVNLFLNLHILLMLLLGFHSFHANVPIYFNAFENLEQNNGKNWNNRNNGMK